MDQPAALLVEDDPDVHRLVFDLLRDEGLAVTGVMTVREAVRLLEAGYRPAIAVIDHVLPDGDVVEVCRRLKQLTPDLGIRCLLFSSATNLAELAAAAGADAWLQKPFELPTLQAQLATLRSRIGTGPG